MWAPGIVPPSYMHVSPYSTSKAFVFLATWRACQLVSELDDGHACSEDTLYVAVQTHAVAMQQPPRRLRRMRGVEPGRHLQELSAMKHGTWSATLPTMILKACY